MKVRLYRYQVKPANNSLRQFLLYFTLFLFASLPVLAQQVNPMFYREIQLERKKTYTLQSITREIQQQTGISFSYNASRISPSIKIRMKSDRITVEQLLASIRKKTGIGYKVISKTHIIYTASGNMKMARKKSRDKKRTAMDVLVHNNPEMVLRPLATDSVAGQQIIIVGDSAVAGYYFSGGVTSGGGYSGNILTKYPVMLDVTGDEEIEEDTYEPDLSRNTNKNYLDGKAEFAGFLKKNVLVGIGISADEVYYLNPTVRAGFDFLYGTVSYNIGPFPHWRYGIGGSARVNDNWRLHAAINTGKSIFQDYNIQTFDTIPPNQPDTVLPPTIIETNTPLVVKSKLTRISVSAEWDLGKGLLLGVGITWNRLKTDYSSNGSPVTLSNLLPIGYDADERYRTIKPPYLLGNTYSGNQSSNVKTWLGLQLTLIYRLKFFD